MNSSHPLSGCRVVISAGPTFEDIDPVRFIGNRSSGKMGFALAEAAVKLGAQVVLIAGPVALATPEGVERIDVRSARQMHEAVMAALPADVYIGAAAVADFTPAEVAPGKIKKQPGVQTMTLQLVRTPDILADVCAHFLRPRLVIGFAAETDDVIKHARAKLASKKLDLIAANRVGLPGSGFESDDSALTVLWEDGERALDPAAKTELAAQLLELIGQRLEA